MAKVDIKTPYSDLPEYSFWRRSIASTAPSEIDPAVNLGLRVDKNTRIATAGSCFAQHIARRLVANGYNYYVTEPSHALMTSEMAASYNYGTFSARYGNIYTSLQLRQLIERAFGKFQPVEGVWFDNNNKTWIDPFRPNIQPFGFSSKTELIEDRRMHLGAVRELMKGLEVFVFTFGLTECWVSNVDGAVFPLCPGVSGGVFDSSTHSFRNLGVNEVLFDMRAFISQLRDVNPASDIILTVSPVPLIATAGRSHVLTATTYSKSVLRVAAETLCQELDNVFYFPSYEIITSIASRGGYFADDCREVTKEGIDHVMRVFFRHAAGVNESEKPDAMIRPNLEKQGDAVEILAAAQNVVDTVCDELLIEEHAYNRNSAHQNHKKCRQQSMNIAKLRRKKLIDFRESKSQYFFDCVND
ncbi:GSCFA domain-containing protein [Thiocystis violacea]|uniref:GSCFA domain-containing protein n=1 Tax=Thiocystis violacea TaxID=13725 RepID=UPI001908CD04|nr:GSCFA domain-containing protein [Thiocystis violacea]MBK1720030.1 hypothetical protein [Thiocystis violacea]